MRAARKRMLEAAAAAVGRVAHCSTEAILFPEEPTDGAPVRKDYLPPVEAMSGVDTRSKHAAEQAALGAAQDGLDVVIASPTVPAARGEADVLRPCPRKATSAMRRRNRFPPGESSPARFDSVMRL